MFLSFLLGVVLLTQLIPANGSSRSSLGSYQGCYMDDRADVNLTGEKRETTISMSLEQCNSYCFVRGYLFSATKNGQECHCGDLNSGPLPRSDDDRLCNTPCPNDLSTKCGGRNAYSLYSTGIIENNLSDISQLEIGCLSDEDEIRLIKEHKADLMDTNSPKRCIAYCKALGYQHAGLQYGLECYCGSSDRTSPLVEGCDMPCTGDENLKCGGNWRINVYSTGISDNSIEVRLHGCFEFNENTVVTRRNIFNMTPNICIAHCFLQALPFAHIHNGYDCYCGRNTPPYKYIERISKCGLPCPGDNNDICGSGTHMLTYSTGIIGDPILGKFESCYRDEYGDLIVGPKFNLSTENSVVLCLSRCIELGFTFAGVRKGSECMCSQESPKRSLLRMVPYDGCIQPCPKIELQDCGGDKRTGLYRTGLLYSDEIIRGDVLPQYKGCFKDNRNEVRLNGDQKTLRGLSTYSCNAFCFGKGFLYAATKDGKECYCGDLEGDIPTPDDESLCNAPCSSDIALKCGGKNAFSLFSTGIIEDDVGSVEDLEIGCITDSEDIRLIPEHKIDFTLTNTPKRCIAYCKALGFIHAGIQYSLECYCGMARKTSPSVEGCDLPCAGDPTQSCGGHWKANVYSTGITKPTPGISTRGCYIYDKSLIVIRKVIPEINQNKCASHCYLQGYQYAFVHNGFECVCGRNLPSSKFRANSAKCSIVCENDRKFKCGGGNENETFMTAYTTGVVGDPILGRLVGCYKDENNDLLTGPKLNLGARNSIKLCVSRCIEMGYAFAGLRNTFECQCSQTSPKRTPVKIVPDYECTTECPEFRLQSCGAPLYTSIHRTGVVPRTTDNCVTSVSRVNGKQACGGQILFSETFDTLDPQKWYHTVKISGEDAEFVTYTKKRKNIDVKDGKLIIKPTLVTDKFVKYGFLQLKGCTGDPSSLDCNFRAKSYHIIPPIESGQICTRRSFNFKYGVINVEAKFPKGDWVVPQFWLKPVKNEYGEGYRSGKIIVATSSGNPDLIGPEGTDIGSRFVQSGFQVSEYPDKEVTSRLVTVAGPEPWYNAFHNYSLTWTNDTVLFYVDGNIVSGLQTAYTNLGKTLMEEMGFSKKSRWSKGTILAPFDQEFYLCLGLSVGGVQAFPDGSVSNGVVKPWNNNEMKNRLKFWLNRQFWLPTWSEDTKLEVKNVQITAY